MKLLFVGTNPENTGATSHFVALAQAMAVAGHQVGAVVYPDGLIWQGLAGSDVRLSKAKFRNAFDLRGYLAVIRAARQLKPDWLVGNFGKEYWPLILIGRLLRIPVALFRHRTPPMKRLSGWLIPRLAQRFLAVSEHARQAYLDRGVPSHLVRVLYNPVNMAQCRPDSQRRREILRALGLDEQAIVLGYSGRMHGGKGIFPLFEAASAAMAQQPRLHCLWLGDGPDAAALRERAAADPTADRHHFLGWIPDVLPYYSALSMLAFPSVATETFGRVSVEAQAAGVPVLGSDIGGIPETLQAGVTGLLLPPGDVAAWREAILKLCDPALLASMGAAAHDYVEQHFSMLVIAGQFLQILSGD
ncbi:glycosyl transferase family 1 [Rhodanobacter thiooxydans]|uniref:Glycosyl transferase family 1 n=1 Tax=Rhodanobacter thiooxydans TaxID=416169 RepID=A0A154QJD9_9GAMM|nr:glycosyltransferase family 4 protein [Rhodanobacter thiooxydans]EIL97646.1 glycosyl transferase [Rhodanobacter thiooxydans LCS2]KZC23934.1 glycosyl transferase family 1 [Rhodanobacter thiooxydans]MCW0201789.1 glycosyltransferase family 4 protein [Rhodanobacter thiooxydans]